MQQDRATLVGRESQVHRVAETLRRTGSAHTLLVTGRAGIGKTAVVEQARRSALQEGARVLTPVWEDGPAGVAALADTVCGLLASIHDGRLPLRITAVRRAQWGNGGRAAGELALLSTLSETLADAAHHVPFALLVDDADLIPAPTAAALQLMLRVFRPAGLPVVLAGRPAAPGYDGYDGPAAVDEVLDLPPLRPEEVTDLVARRLGRPAEPALVAAVSRALGPLAGNPAAVLSVLGVLDESGGLLELDGWVGLAEPDGCLRLTTGTAELGRLGWPGTPSDTDLIADAAVLAGVTQSAELRLDDLPGPGPLGTLDRTVDRLVGDGVLTIDPDGRLSFAVPALAAALRRPAADDHVRAMHASVTRAGTDRLGPDTAGAAHPHLAGHLEAAGALLDDEPAVRLLLAAARKDSGADQARAARSYRAALRRLPPEDPRTPGVLREAAALSLRYADHAGVLEREEPLLACLRLPDHTDRESLEFATGVWVLASLHEHRSPHADADAAADAADAADNADSGFGEVLRRMPQGAALAALGGLYGIGPIVPRPAAAERHLSDDRVIGSGPLPSAAELRLLTTAVGGRAELERAWRKLPPGTVSEAAVGRLRNAAAYGDLAGALEAVLEDRYIGAGHSAAIRYRAMVRDYLGGHWDGALAQARGIERRGRAEGIPGVGQLARALAADIHLFRGDIGRAREWLGLVPDTVTHPLVARVRMGARYWSGQRDEALEQGWRDVERARRSGLLMGMDSLLLRILMFAAESAPVSAWRALEGLEELHEEAATGMTHEALLLARGILYRDVGSAHIAYDLVKRRGDALRTLYCCQCLAEISDDPQRWLAESAQRAHRLTLGRPVRAVIGRSAQRRNMPLPRWRSTEAGLSEQDVRLIGMVSDGATNRQIAARLACSEKTVEKRLASLFRRTGHRSRVELAAAWLDGTLARPGLVPEAPPAETGEIPWRPDPVPGRR
ncbi:LuxR family transcriptional regulator [Streptomyces sp. NPDC005573]|uniref:helix-turn-helix transcriptional regulator n=1 Tax=Streptomyces sp. NPDC005573 TaxID=3156890 RepID=UPI0033A0B37F